MNDMSICHSRVGSPPEAIHSRPRSGCLFLWLAYLVMFGMDSLLATEAGRGSPPRVGVTTVAQFGYLAAADFLAGCDFRLRGIVTLVDTQRGVLVLQDDTGAVALHYSSVDFLPLVGQSALLEGTNCTLLQTSFPSYPHRPAGFEVRDSFEGPQDRGEYHLTRMRALVHPPRTGQYTFWIASDNSSELWLSADESPWNARRIATVPRYNWVAPREWTKFPSQRSAVVQLRAGEAYYLEALGEQNVGGANLAVAWQGPSLNRSVISDEYTTPWQEMEIRTNGVLLEYWTNYSASDVEGLTRIREFESALSVKQVRATILGKSPMPAPVNLALNQTFPSHENYRWAQIEGVVKFVGMDGLVPVLEVTDGQSVVQVRALSLAAGEGRRLRNASVRVEGVCEGLAGPGRSLAPGVIWATMENGITVLASNTMNAIALALDPVPPTAAITNPAMPGFYTTRGVVTFNGNVLGSEYIFVQRNAAVVRVATTITALKEQLKLGRWTDLGGSLSPGERLPVISPLSVRDLGARPMPLPITRPLASPLSDDYEGRWCELAGVVQAVNPDGTLVLADSDGMALLWLGQMPSNQLAGFVDARVRARGVLMLERSVIPSLLVPSPAYVDVESPPPPRPFELPLIPIADAFPAAPIISPRHRVRVAGRVTYRDTASFFIQDRSGGARVLLASPQPVEVGQSLEVVAFPDGKALSRRLVEALIRPGNELPTILPKQLELNDAVLSHRSGELVRITATLLAHKPKQPGHVLELQEQQRVFLATLAITGDRMPTLEPGSRLQVTGVCDNEPIAAPTAGDKSGRAAATAPLNLLLRSSQDVVVISGAPWWTLRRTLTLVGLLFGVIVGSLLWIQFLRRRLERQHAARTTFSRQMLERIEDERRRIAVNLHDSLGQTLMVIKNHALLAMQRPAEEPTLRRRLDEISDATSQAIEEVRQITHGLRPYQLDRLGLSQAIRASIDRATTGSAISFATRIEDIDGLFDAETEIHLYRIVQEGVTNVVKHSMATEAAVVIKRRAAAISLSIRDNGRGFNAEGTRAHTPDAGYGLSGIAERARILGATCTIDSQPGAGTALTVEVPLPTLHHVK